MSKAATILLTALLTSGGSFAQTREPDQSTPRVLVAEDGARLRVSLRDGQVVEGSLTETNLEADVEPGSSTGLLEALTGDSFLLALDSETLTIRTQEVERIDVASAKHTSHRGWLGAAVGAGAGFALGYAAIKTSCNQPDCMGSDYANAFGGAFALLGAGIGYAMGRSIKRESYEWNNVYTKSSVELSVAPVFSRDFKGAIVRLAF